MTDIVPEAINPRQLIAGTAVLGVLLAGITLDIILLQRAKKTKISRLKALIRLKKRPWDLYDVIYFTLVMGLFFAALTLIATIIDKFGINISDNTERLMLLIQTAVMQIIAVGTILKLRREHDLRNEGSAFSTDETSPLRVIPQAAAGYLAIIPAVFLAAAIINPLLAALNIPLVPQEALEQLTDPAAPLWMKGGLLLLATVTAPIAEELLFRGVLLPAAVKYISPGMAIFSVSALFALIHGNIAAIAPLMTLSIGLCLAYIYTGRILVPIIIHSIFNTASLALLLYIMQP